MALTGGLRSGQAARRRTFVLAGSCGVPADAKAVSADLAVAQPAATGSLTCFPGNALPTGATSVSFRAGVTRANNAVLFLATDGAGSIGVQNDAARDRPLHRGRERVFPMKERAAVCALPEWRSDPCEPDVRSSWRERSIAPSAPALADVERTSLYNWPAPPLLDSRPRRSAERSALAASTARCPFVALFALPARATRVRHRHFPAPLGGRLPAGGDRPQLHAHRRVQPAREREGRVR